jgi:hypothetical protein
LVFRIVHPYDFTLVDRGEQITTPIPCRIEIVTQRRVRVDSHNLVISAANDARLSMHAHATITDYISRTLEGQQFDGPIPGLGINGHTDYAPEMIVVWAYWLARGLCHPMPGSGTWRLSVESARVVIAGKIVVEYVPEGGDR